MPTIRFEGVDYLCAEGESVLDCLTRHGVMLPSSCMSGACQTCMIRARKGKPTQESQMGLKDTLKALNYFLACVCRPTEDMEIGLSDVSNQFAASVIEKQLLNESVVRLRLSKPDGFEYKAGQFVNLVQSGSELTRSYSLASLPTDAYLELHIKRVPDGRMSNWIFDVVNKGDELSFFGPAGDCFYVEDDQEQPVLLIGTGTGLAPLYGIMRDMLAKGHRGTMHLYHGSLAAPGLYLEDELRQLALQYSSLSYVPCVLHGEPPEGGLQGNITDLAVDAIGSLSGYRVYLCGDPPIVNALRQKAFLAGASMQQIHADPFVFSDQT